jgi:hypothetical protein
MKSSAFRSKSGTLTFAVAIAFGLSGTADADTITAEKAKQKEWVSCATGAAAGGVLGGFLGTKLAKELGVDSGAASAAAAAGGAVVGCVIAKQLTAGDTRQIQETEAAAAKDGASNKTWKNEEGKTVTVESKAEPVTITDKPKAVCKSVVSTTKVARGQPAVSKQVYCADVGGDYKEAGLVL